MKPLFPLIFLFLSCHTARIAASLEAPDRLPVLPESVINVPLKIYAKPFVQKAEAMTPLEFTSEGWPAYLQAGCDFRYKYRLSRSALRFTCKENNATVSLVGNYQLAGSKSVCAFGKRIAPWINGSCGFHPEPMRRIQIDFGSALQLRPDYTIRSHSGVQKIIPLDKCVVSLLNTDITTEVSDNIRVAVNAFASSLDKTVAGIDISKAITNVGAVLGRKIPLDNFGFLKANIAAVRVSTINLDRDTVYLTAGFHSYPEVSSDSINHDAIPLLPPLITSRLPSGFIIHANADYAYSFIDDLLNYLAKDKSINIAGRKIVIEKLSVRGLADHRVELSVNFTGEKSGRLYLTGTPSLDTVKQIISIPDLNYSIRSRDLVLNLGEVFFKRRIIRTIRRKASLEIDELYRRNKRAVDSAFNRRFEPNVTTSGNTTGMKMQALVVKPDRLLFQVSLSGFMSVTVSAKEL